MNKEIENSENLSIIDKFKKSFSYLGSVPSRVVGRVTNYFQNRKAKKALKNYSKVLQYRSQLSDEKREQFDLRLIELENDYELVNNELVTEVQEAINEENKSVDLEKEEAETKKEINKEEVVEPKEIAETEEVKAEETEVEAEKEVHFIDKANMERLNNLINTSENIPDNFFDRYEEKDNKYVVKQDILDSKNDLFTLESGDRAIKVNVDNVGVHYFTEKGEYIPEKDVVLQEIEVEAAPTLEEFSKDKLNIEYNDLNDEQKTKIEDVYNMMVDFETEKQLEVNEMELSPMVFNSLKEMDKVFPDMTDKELEVHAAALMQIEDEIVKEKGENHLTDQAFATEVGHIQINGHDNYQFTSELNERFMAYINSVDEFKETLTEEKSNDLSKSLKNVEFKSFIVASDNKDYENVVTQFKQACAMDVNGLQIASEGVKFVKEQGKIDLGKFAKEVMSVAQDKSNNVVKQKQNEL